MSPRPGLNLGVWRTLLLNDADRDLLLSGLKKCFDIVDSDLLIVPVEVENHPSARPGSTNYLAIKQQVLQEISEGNYIVCDTTPNFISPLGAIPKSTGVIRLIHDCSRPSGKSLNDYANLEFSQRFQIIGDATSLLQPGYYMAKVDLKSAYRSVSIKVVLNNQVAYLRDTKLPFGSRLAPGIFHRLTHAVKRMMIRRWLYCGGSVPGLFLHLCIDLRGVASRTHVRTCFHIRLCENNYNITGKNNSGDTSNVNNYRPIITLVTVALNIFEIILLEPLTRYLDNTIKFGFKKGHSTYHYIFAINILH